MALLPPGQSVVVRTRRDQSFVAVPLRKKEEAAPEQGTSLCWETPNPVQHTRF